MRLLLSFLLLLVLAGCAARPAMPVRPVHGVEIATLQGGVTISLETASGSTGGRGYLFFRKPDTFRLSILSPFGQTFLDLFVSGERVTCLLPSKKQAWRGSMEDLPENLGAKVWPLLQWVVETPHPAGPALERSFSRADGTVEKVYYDRNGFVLRKVNDFGDEVLFGDYRVTEDVAIPWRIEVKTADGDRLQLLFDEPEVNGPLDDELLKPSLAGMEILPLAQFRGP
ncbi:MAG TPA: lipoprotein insertase outer membrane protein LolB [Geobacteraceae bacterium]|nr:lipoprotein insertase outer membrane protein LolB [Geobacteraceae bacterium]